ncbi:MAG TPA: DUF192 domain-containing protein [Rhodocyclaceae bacterium]|nr:DUF192 domain-containing protein [Rhodocyclaceae bacterium]
MPQIELSAGIHRIRAEVAHTDATRQQGLMHRRVMAPQDGMLFVFESSERFCMWMKNTYLPLSVAFIDESGTILNIEDMAPQTEDSHCAAKPARYALEMNLGWFVRRGLQAGGKISGIERAPSAR